jgi:hypothetical protein
MDHHTLKAAKEFSASFALIIFQDKRQPVIGRLENFSGEPWRARTSDPLIKSQLLYQLS